MLLATKAVGDFLGVNGIADEMIRFNGYPFLEKADHYFNTAGKSFPGNSPLAHISVMPLKFLVSCVQTCIYSLHLA